MNGKRYIGWFVLLFLTAVTLGVIKSAGIRFGNQEFTVEPAEYNAAPFSEVVVAAETTAGSVLLEGQVTTADGKAVIGALVTISGAGGNHRITGFSDENGHYRLLGALAGEIDIRVYSPLYQDSAQKIVFGPDRSARLDVSPIEIIEAELLAETTAASGHAALLDWPDRNARNAFVRQCNFCHQIGNELTRSPRDLADWRDVVDRMEGYLVLLNNAHVKIIGETLANTLPDGSCPRALPLSIHRCWRKPVSRNG